MNRQRDLAASDLPARPDREDTVADGADAARVRGPLLFAGGPLRTLVGGIGLIRRDKPQTMHALAVVLAGWLPLVLLTAWHGDLVRWESGNSFILDFGIYTRFLIAAPLLLMAEAISVPRLAAIAREFIAAGLVRDVDRGRYEAAISSSRRLMGSRMVALGFLVIAYTIVFALVEATPAGLVPSWQGRLSPFAPSLAGWWSLLVSLPLLLLLLLGWLWRIFLWTRFLWLMNRVDLQLVPAHPDRAAGLGFVGSSLQAFMPFGFILGVIAAGPVANQVVHHHLPPQQFRSVAITTILISLALCVAPLLVFMRRLIEQHYRGILQYGALAMHVGERFQSRWLKSNPLAGGPLDMSEFTGPNSLFSMTANARSVRFLPLELRSVGLLALVTFLPFVPVWLVDVRFADLAKTLRGFLL
jgi:hypothetical protein